MTSDHLEQINFDGLCIQTDSLDSPLTDSVFPIFDEEQIFMCRQMKPAIEHFRQKKNGNLNVLDIGTGSGVLAMFVERVFSQQEGIPHPYTIRAIDRSERAIELTRHNCQINSCCNVQILPPQPYSDQSVEPYSQDLILINPPFNPTYPKLLRGVALSADDESYTGLRIFREWLNYLPAHLHSDGLVIGYQMSPVCGDKIIALEELRAALGAESTLRYCRSLPEDYDTFQFLTAMYQSYLETSARAERNSLEAWIERTAKAAPKLALIYYEAAKQGNSSQAVKEIERIWQHQSSWGDRIRLHQTVVENYRK